MCGYCIKVVLLPSKQDVRVRVPLPASNKYFGEFNFLLENEHHLSKFYRRTTGIEPANDGATIHCLTTWPRSPPFHE